MFLILVDFSPDGVFYVFDTEKGEGVLCCDGYFHSIGHKELTNLTRQVSCSLEGLVVCLIRYASHRFQIGYWG